jgi:hypothetical protein
MIFFFFFRSSSRSLIFGSTCCAARACKRAGAAADATQHYAREPDVVQSARTLHHRHGSPYHEALLLFEALDVDLRAEALIVRLRRLLVVGCQFTEQARRSLSDPARWGAGWMCARDSFKQATLF